MNTYRVDLVTGGMFFVQAESIQIALEKAILQQKRKGAQVPDKTICAVTEVGEGA